ncbi:ABC transporter ATP-binding protein [Paenibacillus sp. HN-1]|uniref:ABC transporter ATP-binding protein n=1 Tax=Paenibacillus TaxID=44249 RepID=UPI001CA8982F|nr:MULTISPECIES: ABC transporter ATP-binding protein [Paenibacillus]MBY9079866.1 ABC transporter ATP-binding protein [Paenibacillus sp. CGMCC 1.18879]MBY9084507.1 ABC transporter ATP-binding protein [Paenibacillus sinensis]
MSADGHTSASGEDIVLDVAIQEAGYEEGDVRIADISFTVRRGQLLGLIGPNGAGKSTTIKTLLGLLKYAKASVSIGGDAGTYAYVPEQPIFYEDLTLWEHLDLSAAAHGLEYGAFKEQAERLLHLFGMENVRDDLPAGFSKGMKQKMMLLLGFLAKPDVYIVDEPFIGLDPRATKDFLRLLDAERRRGAGVLMSTHVLDTAEKICDSFVLVSAGRVAASGTLEDIRATAGMPEASLFDCFDALA